MKIKGVRKLAKKWARETGNSAPAYVDGSGNPRTGEPHIECLDPKKFVRNSRRAARNWARGWAPYRRVLMRLKLPPRGPVRSPENYKRVEAVCLALHEEKVRRQKARVVRTLTEMVT